jgi:hypothetical protein
MRSLCCLSLFPPPTPNFFVFYAVLVVSRRLMRSPCCLSVCLSVSMYPVCFRFLCDLCLIKENYAISYFQNFCFNIIIIYCHRPPSPRYSVMLRRPVSLYSAYNIKDSHRHQAFNCCLRNNTVTCPGFRD